MTQSHVRSLVQAVEAGADDDMARLKVERLTATLAAAESEQHAVFVFVFQVSSKRHCFGPHVALRRERRLGRIVTAALHRAAGLGHCAARPTGALGRRLPDRLRPTGTGLAPRPPTRPCPRPAPIPPAQCVVRFSLPHLPFFLRAQFATQLGQSAQTLAALDDMFAGDDVPRDARARYRAFRGLCK